MLDFTHEATTRSWVLSAQTRATDFPIQNLPFGVFSNARSSTPRGGVAIGDQVLDLALLAESSLLDGASHDACKACAESSLNTFMAMGRESWKGLRHSLFELLAERALPEVQRRLGTCLVAQADVQMHLPATVRNYTDFFTSLHHALNGGRIARPDNPLLTNFKWLPSAYHGRASSVVLSGTPIRRPKGQARPSETDMPSFGPSKRLDFELELGFYVGRSTELGESISIDRVGEHIFGICLLNDWSARDIQFWEMDPLGPFLGKNFGTSVSPWVVTMDALEPFRTALHREADDPPTLSYLDHEKEKLSGAYDIQLQVLLETEAHRTKSIPGDRISSTSFKHQYWTVGQMLTHHSVNGCNVLSGDLMGTGTISGPTKDQAGSIVELTDGGQTALSLFSTGEMRAVLEDGDAVVLLGYCEREGFVRIGFGECYGRVLPAVD